MSDKDEERVLTDAEKEEAAKLAGWTPEVSEEVPDEHGLPPGDDIVEQHDS